MPRYYFHFADERRLLRDAEGISLPDEEAAWYHAVRSGRELVAAEPDAPGRFEVEDEEGVPVCAVPLAEIARIAP